MTRRFALAGTSVGVLCVPSIAHAHVMSTGLGPFYDGLAHLFVTPADLLPVVALALLAGLRGPAWGRAVLLGLSAAWLAGSAVGSTVALSPVAAAAATVVLGGLVAADAKLLPGPLCAAAVALGLATGSASSPGATPLLTAAFFVAGSTAAAFVVVSLVAGQVASLRTDAARIAVRVAGSWIAAIGLLMLGWSLR